ncbi:MAG TPA: hypothetical protein VE377_09105 [Candidatus Dormibacteraeota bacterium]|nr:hypothetical protein [Candidatus Dormibacteraeota bacterium]
MKRFLRYFCFYCASRLVYETARGLMRKHPRQAAPACKQHASGFLIGIFLLLTAVPLMAFAIFGAIISK